RQNDVACLHGGVVQDLALIHHTYGKAGQVVFFLGHHAGVLGSFAAHQGAARLHAAFGHALDDLGNLFGDVFAASNVIQEHQRLGAGANDVIDAHGHTVNANGIMLVHILGYTQFGADAV